MHNKDQTRSKRDRTKKEYNRRWRFVQFCIGRCGLQRQVLSTLTKRQREGSQTKRGGKNHMGDEDWKLKLLRIVPKKRTIKLREIMKEGVG